MEILDPGSLTRILLSRPNRLGLLSHLIPEHVATGTVQRAIRCVTAHL